MSFTATMTAQRNRKKYINFQTTNCKNVLKNIISLSLSIFVFSFFLNFFFLLSFRQISNFYLQSRLYIVQITAVLSFRRRIDNTNKRNRGSKVHGNNLEFIRRNSFVKRMYVNNEITIRKRLENIKKNT